MLTQRSKLPERRPRTSAAPGARRVGRDFNLNAVIGAYLFDPAPLALPLRRHILFLFPNEKPKTTRYARDAKPGGQTCLLHRVASRRVQPLGRRQLNHRQPPAERHRLAGGAKGSVAPFGENLNGSVTVPAPLRLIRPSAIRRRHIKLTRCRSFSFANNVSEISAAVRPGWRPTSASSATETVRLSAFFRHDTRVSPSDICGLTGCLHFMVAGSTASGV
jgi:hypothetical protein